LSAGLDAGRAVKLQWQEPGSVDHELIWGSIALAGLIAFTALPVERVMSGTGYCCPFHAVTGLPCPTCGGTNPLVAAGWCGAVLFVPYALFVWVFGRKRLRITGVTRRQSRVLAILFVCVALANWAYLLARR